MTLRSERIRTAAEETCCDWCGYLLGVEDSCVVTEHGGIYCGRTCAENDAFDAAYAPVCAAVSHWSED